MAANHIFGLGNPVPTATATLAAAILVISAMPAQGQQKIGAYCELDDLTDRFDQAVEEKDTKKAAELSQKGEELLRKLGPEFAALADGMQSVDLSSQDVREIGSIVGNLSEQCK
jgi:hypothetical protein